MQSSQAPSNSSAAPPFQTSVPQPQPTFPAYQGQQSTDGGAPPVATLPEAPVRVAAKVPPVGANCKLMHPEEDISMVSTTENILSTWSSVCNLVSCLHTPQLSRKGWVQSFLC